MKKLVSVLLTLAVVLGLSLVPVVPVAAGSQTFLSSTGAIGTGNEDRIVVSVPAGTTLGDIESIAWSEYLVQGYPPHVDIIIDVAGATDALVVEYAYNDHVAAGQPTYEALTGAWYQTFDDDGDGPAVIDGNANAWLTTGAAGGIAVGTPIDYTAVDNTKFVYGTLSDWQNGNIVNDIDANTSVLRLEIEVDNWLVDTEAWVKDILVNGSPAGNTAVGLTTNVPSIVAISVNPTVIDFGTLLPGQTSATFNIIVDNIGTHKVDVDADVDDATSTPLFYYNLELSIGTSWSLWSSWTNIVKNLAMDDSETLYTKLPVPPDYTPKGTESGLLIFEATPV